MRSSFKKLLLSIPPVKAHFERVQILSDELIALRKICDHSRSPALTNSLEDLSTERLLTHPATLPLPNVSLGSKPAKDNTYRIEIAERLLAAYHKSIASDYNENLKRDGEDLWSDLLRTELPQLMTIVEESDAEKLSEFLKHFGDSFVWFGGITTCIDGYNRNLDPKHIAITYLDKLVCLGEYLGAIPLENPESGSWGGNLHIDPQELVNKIESAISISIAPPLGAIHTDGLAIGNNLFHYRHINGLYSAIRSSQLAGPGGNVCEIGGGLGITAMYSRRLGISDYTMLDLPISCLLAGHYLLNTVGNNSVVLYGESEQENAIKIYPYWECENLPDNYFDLILNQDSLPEIADNLIREYLLQIYRLTTGSFLSINHEYSHPRTVRNFVSEASGFKNVYRHKCWVREGYVEELYHINKKSRPNN